MSAHAAKIESPDVVSYSYAVWLRECATMALSAEWVIEDGPLWERWFVQGWTPERAVVELFAMVREANP